MKKTTMKPDDALDLIVCDWTQQFQNVHFRTEATHYRDKGTGDEFITVYGAVTDARITVWLSPHRFGNEVVEMARDVIKNAINR